MGFRPLLKMKNSTPLFPNSILRRFENYNFIATRLQNVQNARKANQYCTNNQQFVGNNSKIAAKSDEIRKIDAVVAGENASGRARKPLKTTTLQPFLQELGKDEVKNTLSAVRNKHNPAKTIYLQEILDKTS